MVARTAARSEARGVDMGIFRVAAKPFKKPLEPYSFTRTTAVLLRASVDRINR
jgi:hypothetical protein